VVFSGRNVLLQRAVIGAGVVAGGIPGMEALAAGQPPERRTLEGLAWNDPIVATYRDAVGLLKQKSASDKTGWAGLAAIHGLNPIAYKFCPHGNWCFLPWNTAYILTYERIIRQLTHNDDFALPYWDWTTNPTMPEVFIEPKTKDGKPNSLYVDDQDFRQTWKRTWPASDPMPSRFVGPSVLQDKLNSPHYESFGTSRPPKQDSLDQSWVHDRTGAQGTLERLPHNMVHNNIGGWMPSAMSPRDPIFFMHHCNPDRIWGVWNSMGNSNSDDHFWKDMTFTDNFVNPDGSSYSPKVSELTDPEKLGYTYGLPPSPVATTSFPNLIALRGKLVSLRAPGVPKAPDVRTYTATTADQNFGTTTKPLTVPVNVDAALIAAVSKRRPVSSGIELLNFAAAREQRATGDSRSRIRSRRGGHGTAEHRMSGVSGLPRCDRADPGDGSGLRGQLRDLRARRARQSWRWRGQSVFCARPDRRDAACERQRVASVGQDRPSVHSRARLAQRPGRHHTPRVRSRLHS
jgi:tyrosinase